MAVQRSGADPSAAAWALREALDMAASAGQMGGGSSEEGGGGGGGGSGAVAVMRICSDAIELGVPLYNAGEHAACADVYAQAAAALLDMPASALSPAARAKLASAATAGGSGSDRAWALRRALDHCLGGGGKPGQGGAAGQGEVVLASEVATGVLVDFRQAVPGGWRVVNDSVMGGVSRAAFMSASAGHAELHGPCSSRRRQCHYTAACPLCLPMLHQWRGAAGD